MGGGARPWSAKRALNRSGAAALLQRCLVLPVAGSPFSLLSLANNCGVAATLEGVEQRFLQLYRRRLCELGGGGSNGLMNGSVGRARGSAWQHHGCPRVAPLRAAQCQPVPKRLLSPLRADVHHYTAHIEAAELEAAADAVGWLAESYRQLGDASRPPDLARLRPQEFGRSGAVQLGMQ